MTFALERTAKVKSDVDILAEFRMGQTGKNLSPTRNLGAAGPIILPILQNLYVASLPNHSYDKHAIVRPASMQYLLGS